MTEDQNDDVLTWLDSADNATPAQRLHLCAWAAEEIRKLRAEPQWQPIETAPKRVPILLYEKHLLKYDDEIEVIWADIVRDDGSFVFWPNMPWVPAPATHWRPLPEGPSK